jgi:hypothetical protein
MCTTSRAHHCFAREHILRDADRVNQALAAGNQLKVLQVILGVEAPGAQKRDFVAD